MSFDAADAAQADRVAEGRVRRRHVFYLAGFDPLAPRRYRELYRAEAPKQAAWSGYRIAVDGKTGPAGPQSLAVTTEIGGCRTEAVIEFLRWNDLVKQAMSTDIPRTFWEMARVLWVYFGSGVFWPLYRLARPPMLAGLYPAAMLIAQVLLGLAIGAVLAWALPGPGWLGWGVLALSVLAVLVAFRARDETLFVYYLVYYLALAVAGRGATAPALDARLDAFAARLRAVADGAQADEILLVGHSSGAALAVLVLDKLFAGDDPPTGKFALLTLGSVIPMFSFLPEARALRGGLQRMSERGDIVWIDVTAPGDGGCFALADPVAVSGVATARQIWPKVISAAFSQTLSPALDRATRWRFFRRHLQYLCAFDRPRDYDYFQITAGPVSLAARFAARGSSAARKTAPVSPYRSV